MKTHVDDEPGSGCHLSIFIPSKVEIHCLARSEMPAMAQDGTSIVTPNGADCDWGGEDPEIWYQWPEPGFPAGTTCSHFGSCCWMGPQKLIKKNARGMYPQ